MEDDRRRICLLIYARARVRAPAMEVVGVEAMVDAEVVVKREVREESRASEMSRKGRYLLASSVGWVVFERGRDAGGPLEGPFNVRRRFLGTPASGMSVSTLWVEPFWWADGVAVEGG